MKKIWGILSWIIAIAGTFGMMLTTWFIDNYIVFYVGLGMLIVGIISILFTCEKSKKFIWKLLDLI